MKNYYNILGVHPSSSKEEIKSAYWQLAKKFHPDLNHNDPQAEEKFKGINEAQEILLDDEKRKDYDNRWRAREEQKARREKTKAQQAEFFRNSQNAAFAVTLVIILFIIALATGVLTLGTANGNKTSKL